MPLTVRSLGASLVLVLTIFYGAQAQAPTSADVMRSRVGKAKAYIAVKNYVAAIYELEGIKREINDPAVNGVVQVMLMNCYLEQMDYKRAQSLLTELYTAQKSGKPNVNYAMVAGQVVRGARNQFERYKALGLSVTDRNLPVEAAADVDKMRETVEMVITQSKTVGENKKFASDAFALMEEATNARAALARDEFDAKRWKDAVADARESLANSRSTIINAADETPAQPAGNTVASLVPMANQTAPNQIPVANLQNSSQVPNGNQQTSQPVKNDAPKTELAAQTNQPETKKADTPNTVAQNNQTQNNPTPNVPASQTPNTPSRRRMVEPANTANNAGNQTETPADASKNPSPLAVGSLIEYATQKVNPSYPAAARSVRMTGVVRVELVVDEQGDVEVQNTTGPAMLQRAALEAVKKWKFKPFTRDGQPVKATGFLSFNFNL
jgi:periplasmic protein TonB